MKLDKEFEHIPPKPEENVPAVVVSFGDKKVLEERESELPELPIGKAVERYFPLIQETILIVCQKAQER